MGEKQSNDFISIERASQFLGGYDKAKIQKLYRAELEDAYRRYYEARHQCEDAKLDPNVWELELYELFEAEFIEIYRKFH